MKSNIMKPKPSIQVLYKRIALFLSLSLLFSLTVFAQPPSNDNCSNNINRTSNTSCNTNQYDMEDATASTGLPAGCESVGVHYDIWFRFTATNASHTVTISNLESGITNPEVQLYSGSCASLTSVVCGTTTLTGTGLTVGNIYYIRVSNVGAAVTANGQFDICITHPGTPPTNDECTGAISLTSNTSCNNDQYTLRYAAASAGLPAGCESVGVHYDVWFSFTALSTTHTVTISNLGSNITNPELQLYSGTCGSLTSIVCGATTLTGTGLTIGNTYFVRVSNIGSIPTSNLNSRFDICVTHPPASPVNDNCSSATTLISGSTCSTTTGNLYYATSNGPAGACGGATLTTTYDVWFTFLAVNTAQTITVNNLGSRLTTATTYMEVLSGACGSLTSIGCQTVATTNGRRALTGLTVGNFYYVRIYVLLNPTASPSTDWNFNICVQHPPANNECAGATVLTPGATCINTASTLDVATASAAAPACFGATYWDVWFQYTASVVSQTITMSSLGSNLTTANIRIQEYSGTCAGLVPLGACVAGTTLTQVGHIIGNVYYIRVALIAPSINPSLVNSANNNFNICITNAAAPPSNDLCTGAISITSGTTCTNISGTLINATATGGLAACGSATSPEVWYSFVAQSTYPVITLSSIGPNLTTASPRIQLFSGACGLLTSLACTTNPMNTFTAVGGAGLTVGNTYYIRITTNTLIAPVATGTYTFNICVTDPSGATLDYAKSYINITDGTVGGTIDPGDILEIRATLVIGRTGGLVRSVDSLAFFDTLKSNGGLSFIPGSLAIRTNEGKSFGTFTNSNADTDAGWYSTAGPGTDTSIQINLGPTANRFRRGKLRSNSRPSNFGTTCIILATYRVQVNAGYGTKINFGGGAFSLRDTLTGVYRTINFPYDSLMVFESPGTCQNSISQTNVLGDESSGTFGAATGMPSQNRGTSANTNYAYQAFNPSGPNDYYYGVANNTSANGSNNQTVSKPNAARVFNLWDITGDHTSAVNTARGNLPCNLGLPVSTTNPCGNMLIINAAYKTDTAFQFSVSGACSNTYYEISAWFKNICYKCGCDSVGRTYATAGYIPTAAGDTAGVRPNIAIEINGVDYYTTGEILYQGLGGTQTGSDTLNNWVRRAFVYKTGSSQTGFTMSLRNNAPGGGGNDWALDDIALKTCTPTMSYSPTVTPTVCENNTIAIHDTIRSYYDTYVEYKWQRSTNGGATWADVGSSGTGAPVWNGSEWEYVASYTVPGSATTSANNGDMYRVVVATTSANLLSSSCNFTDPITMSLDVLTNCGPVLKTDVLSISGKLINDKARILWTTSKEDEPVYYELERSNNGADFKLVSRVIGYNNVNAEKNHYSYDDPTPVNGKVYYRIVSVAASNAKKYSRIVQLKLTNNRFVFGSVVNPFYQELEYEINSPEAGIAKVQLIDQYGKIVKSENQRIYSGTNALTMFNTDRLPAGVYILKASLNESMIVYRVLKENR